MYLDLAIELMPELLNLAREENITTKVIRAFLDGVGRLPVPAEGNLYPCMWNASLEERLVLMQITTEGAAVASTRRAITSALSQKYASVQRAFEVDYYDEVAHARIGTRWLRYLCSDAARRSEIIEQAKFLRGFLLMSCFAPGQGSIASCMQASLAPASTRAANFFFPIAL
jgi:uncharacterized ferritin-like protein (DUF455 family)